ncbi:unnamed protein product [Caenorhabditis bovis]|uniref:Uncharacterized protein n=1 Tax=Caenorhabditis bovis TaxID=2654633 RepID=A0A8S1EM83_9PELO|nr:unnamed protein product [Caenorhabditis bovis]
MSTMLLLPLICSILLITTTRGVTIGKLLQVPDKDQNLRNLVYKVGLRDANNQIRDTVYWVPATTQFSARKITVMSGGKYYSTWTFDMLLQKSECIVRSTPFEDLPSCKSSGGEKLLCTAHVSLFDIDYSSADSEVHCARA